MTPIETDALDLFGEPSPGRPFVRPLFLDETARSLSRVGVVDIGSNSVRLVVFDGAARSPAYYYNEKVMCGLGVGLAQSRVLNPSGRTRALSALKRFQLLAKGMGVLPLYAVATAAMRDAADGPEFHAQIEAEVGMKVFVIDGEEEARLSAQGVLLGWPEADGLLCDIGGSSMEMAVISNGSIGKRMTSDLGPQKLMAVEPAALCAHIAARIDVLAQGLGTDYKRIYLVGGSWRAFARVDMERRNYPLHVQHEYRLSPGAVRQTQAFLARHTIADLRSRTGTSEARMELVPLASKVLLALVNRFAPNELAVSAYGIREGLLYEQMPDRLRQRDPLLEACRFAEIKDARQPGFGKALYRFIAPILPNEVPGRARIYRAACYLHDVTWRAHPDYRAEVCFDNATRANLGGLSHTERVYMGLALLHRYKNSRKDTPFDAILDLLSEKDKREAEILGKAMRFGAMFTIQPPSEFADLTLEHRPRRVLRLTIEAHMQDLFGEVAQARFRSLAEALSARPDIVVRPVNGRI